MSRQLRIQFPGAIYHVTSRGNRKGAIVVDDTDRDEFFERIRRTVEKYAWEMFAAVLMLNHFHLFFRTPQPNLSLGMQYLLGGYATWFNARYGHSGHLFQGRFYGNLVENETYFWAVSRYAHLNPTPVIVEHPMLWKWSTYAGYADESRRLPWVAYDTVLNAWSGTFGGLTPSSAYCQFVEAGINQPLVSPFDQAIDGWILGSETFADRIRSSLTPADRRASRQERRRRDAPLLQSAVTEAICNVLSVDPQVLSDRHSRHPARALFAYLGYSYTGSTLSELASDLGLSRGDSVPTQIRRVINSAADSELRHQLQLVQNALGLQVD